MRKLLAYIWLFLLTPYASIAEVVVIIHPSNNTPISVENISNIYLGKNKHFANGELAIAINLPADSPTRDIFNEKFIGKPQSQINSFWASLHFTGKGSPPTEKNMAEVIELIKSNPNMIGYIDEEFITDGLKVIRHEDH